jgi:hypothetical protein
VATIKIEGHSGGTSFDGTLVAETSNYNDDKARWLEMRLYRKDDGTGWVLHRVSKSLVYHQLDSDCRRADGQPSGIEMLASDLDRDAEPCEVCHPRWPDQIPAGVHIRGEIPRHTVNHCRTASEVVDRLTLNNRTHKRYWSAPATDLLLKAARAAEEFASPELPSAEGSGVIKID